MAHNYNDHHSPTPPYTGTPWTVPPGQQNVNNTTNQVTKKCKHKILYPGTQDQEWSNIQNLKLRYEDK